MQATLWLLTALVLGGLAARAPTAGVAWDDVDAEQSAPLRILSFNIRYDNPGDGPDRWSERQGLVVKTIVEQDAHLVGLQEAYKHQLDHLLAELPRYAHLGVGRNDGEEAGEYSAILYDRGRFEVLESGTFWLSETPDEAGSKTWGNTIPRICTWGRLRDRENGRVLVMYNTHFDHASQPSRVKSAQLIAKRAATAMGEAVREEDHVPKPQQAPGLIVTGDFNAGEDSEEMRLLLEHEALELVDTFRVLHPQASPAGTFNGFAGRTEGAKIDYVLCNPTLTVLEASIVPDHEDGRYPSDHFPVAASLRWAKEARE
jgi:endonuclease/exonuclease/phosphatase family metal-dependent hydrolase